MSAIFKSFKMFLKQILKDGMLVMAVFAPILAAVFFKFGIPELEKFLSSYFSQESILKDYYGLFDLFLATLTPYMFCFVASMTMLDEYDSNIINHLAITPIRKQGYLISRLVIPTGIAYLYSIINLLLFTLKDWSIGMILLICFLTSIVSMTQSLLIFSFSKNKVEGMAIAKLSGLFMIGLCIPFFLTNGYQYYFSFMPSFWVAKFYLTQELITLLLAFTLAATWYLLLYGRFNKKISS